jgi:hypothetical protein
MAANAFSFLQKGVDIASFQSLAKSLMTFQTCLPLGAKLELEFVLRVHRRSKDYKDGDPEQEKNGAP